MPILPSRSSQGFAAAILIASAAACSAPAEGGPSQQEQAAAAEDVEPVNVLEPEEAEAGWRLLFDGRTTAGWRGFRQEGMPEGWQVVDGALTRVGGGGDIVTSDQFEDFELALQWKLSEGGNSGIMFHVTEDAEQTYHTGPEMQVLDDERHVDGENPLTSVGSNYALHPPSQKTVKPIGEWNEVVLRVQDGRVEQWLNGVKVVEYELGSADWERRVAASKFNAWPGYGRAGRGHIALQDHGDWVAFRNIKIREI
jgi:Domain of Unknown Function (DUF1080)